MVENRVVDALSRRRALLSVMSIEVVGFEKIKTLMNYAQILKNIRCLKGWCDS